MPSANCQPIQDKIDALNTQAREVAELFNTQPPPTAGERQALAAMLRRIDDQIKAATTELHACEGDGPPPAPLDATLSGTVTLTTTSDEAKGPFPLDLSVSLTFDGPRDQVTVTNFPPIHTQPKHTPIGDVTITITLTGGGVGTYANGAITLPLTLHFEPSPTVPFVLQPSDMVVTLTTTAPGSPVDAAGHVVLAGGGNFTGGPPLGGNTGNLTFSGTITPHP